MIPITDCYHGMLPVGRGRSWPNASPSRARCLHRHATVFASFSHAWLATTVWSLLVTKGKEVSACQR
jgi:hypothetical protein